jgi:hypothetical protein
MAAHDVWSRALPEEAEFWRYWLTTDHRIARLSPGSADPGLIDPILDSAGPVIHILDVGAGPLTTLGANALAADYDILLHEAGISPPIRTLPMHGERLT